MTKVLITAIAGYVGSHLAEHFLNQGYEVGGTFRTYKPTSPFFMKKLQEKVQTFILDVLQFQPLRKALVEFSPDVVVHTAAQAIVKRSVTSPALTFATNVIGTINVLECARLENIPHVVHFSTDKVFGNRLNAKEDDPIVATGIYSTSKSCADLAAQSYIENYGMNIAIVRFCNIYGGLDTNRRIIPNTIRQLLEGEAPFIYKEKKPSLREYIYIKDVCEAIHFLEDKKGLWNVGSQDVESQETVVKTIIKVGEELGFWKGIEPKYVESKGRSKIKKQSLDSSKLRSHGWKPKYNFEQGIRETILEMSKWLQA